MESSISTAFCALQCRSTSHQYAIFNRKKLGGSENSSDLGRLARFDLDRLKSKCARYGKRSLLRAVSELGGGRPALDKLKAETGKLVGRLKETISAFPPVNFRRWLTHMQESKEQIVVSSKNGTGLYWTEPVSLNQLNQKGPLVSFGFSDRMGLIPPLTWLSDKKVGEISWFNH